MTASAAAPPRSRTDALLDRLVGALPLVLAFFALAILYAWQASRHVSPWLFTDELEFTQLARSVAESGELARRGEPLHNQFSLYPWVTAPAWWLDDVGAAYEWAKLIGVIAMTAAIVPAYALARLVVSKPAALLAAGASASIPAYAYSAFIIEEPLAYGWSTLCLYLIVRALTVRSRRAIAVAAAGSLVAPLVRDELVLVPLVFVASALALAWGSDRARAWRADWSTWDRVGAAVVAVGALIVFNELYSRGSREWEIVTLNYKDRMLEYGLWAAGALTIGIGVLPLVAGLLALVPARDETPAGRAFRLVLTSGLLGFGLYAAAKAAYISTVFATRVVERNLIYVAPLLFVAAAVVLERRRAPLWALGVSALFAGYLIVTTPYQMDAHFYSDAPGLAILAQANRELGWTPEHAERVLLWVLVASVAVVGATLALRTRFRAEVTALAVAAGVNVVAWNLVGELSAARASNSFSRDFVANLPQPPDWIDRATGQEPTLYLGQQIDDDNGVWLLEFWNRSIRRVYSLDGSAPGPGPTVTPDLTSRFGTLAADPGYEWVVADNGVRVVGELVQRNGALNLYRIDPPLRLESFVSGVSSDAWLASIHEVETVTGTYSRFATPGNRPGTISITISRRGWCGENVPGRVTMRVGTLALGPEKHGGIGRVTAEQGWVVESCAHRIFPLPTPRPPFHVEVAITPPFVPSKLDPASSERRHLGAQVAFEFRPG